MSDLRTRLGDALKAYNDPEKGPHGWPHEGDLSEALAGCAAFSEGLLCCVDPEHPCFESMVTFLAEKIKTEARSALVDRLTADYDEWAHPYLVETRHDGEFTYYEPDVEAIVDRVLDALGPA